MAKLPGGPITPIIFSLTRPAALKELLDPSRRVQFNLDGTAAPQQYSWVKPETAFLVWQPNPFFAEFSRAETYSVPQPGG